MSDLAFAEYLLTQEQVCQKLGKGFARIDRWTATTKRCANCGTQHEMELTDRVMACDCGLTLGRDHNAAINICAEGASSAGLGDVRQRLLSAITASPQESHSL